LWWSSAGSEAPILFEPDGGQMLIETQFIAEMAMAFSDDGLQKFLADVLADEELKRNATFRAMYKQRCEMDSGYEGLQNNFAPGFFLLEEALETWQFKGLASAFNGMEYYAVHGAKFSSQTLLAILSTTSQVAASFIFEKFLHYYVPMFEFGLSVLAYRNTLKDQTHRAKDFTAHLAMKSSCMIQTLKVEILKESTVSHINGYEGILSRDIQDVCSKGMELELENQIQRTTQAKVAVFDQLVSIGKCLYPHGDRAWSKTDCVSAIYFDLLQHGNKSGVLYEALSFMAYYGFAVDELLEEPFYRRLYKDEFGIESNATEVSMLAMLNKVKQESYAERWSVCVAVMAKHRAFEQTFIRIRAGLKIWMQTFARATRFLHMRSSWWPCQKVFKKVGAPYATENQPALEMCKNYDFKVGHGKEEHDIDLSGACTKVADYKGSLWPETENNNDYEDKSHVYWR
jgi:hypothetical protein